jgi:hypothetical protein
MNEERSCGLLGLGMGGVERGRGRMSKAGAAAQR